MNIQNIYKIFEKLVDIGQLTNEEKDLFFENINQGLVLNFLTNGADIVSPEILEKLKISPDQTVIQAYLKEMSESEAGKKIIQDRVVELVNELLESVKDKLTPNQKEELLKILE